ncbi:carboxylesterase 5A [Echinococcus multilocularis]|uniref:Carboxylesterase 5A n=1 Tax=Echinococcus multilocularis TaxID=6211 RepID=A0A068YAG1_ECHMU|nr:carboxylesterase 5A [Echinococcus multilocularis]
MTNTSHVVDCGGEEATSLEATETADHKMILEESPISELSKRPYLSLKALLPSVTEWHQRWHVRNRKRFRLLRILWFTLAAVNLSHLVILLTSLIYTLYVNSWVEMHKLPITDERHDSGLLHYETNCVAIYPEYTGQEDWYMLDFLPYATLPKKRAVFAMSVQITTFQECYNAFWLGVHPSKRQFVNGQLRFLGKRAELSCLQSGRSKVNETATVANCLTVSFRFRLHSATDFSGLKRWGSAYDPKPIVAYIGGHGLLYHRPQLIPLNIVSELDVLYVVIRYRLGVFGFGDFGTPDYGPNHGVEDVRKALQWLYENARLFGGSPKDITLIGEDSGASIALIVSGDRYVSQENENSTQVWIRVNFLKHMMKVIQHHLRSL